MIDTFAVLLTEGLMMLAVWRLLGRIDLDDEETGVGGSWRRGPRA